MKVSDLTLQDILRGLSLTLGTIKVYYNNKVIYNDYDSKVEIEPGLYGEVLPPSIAIAQRHTDLLNKKIFNICAEIVDFHHSIIWFEGEE